MGTAVPQWLRCCATSRKVAGSIPDGVSGFFIDIKSFRSHYGALTEWVSGIFPGGKGGRCIRLTTLPPSCAVVTKSGNLKFLEPFGSLQVCNEIALPLPLAFHFSMWMGFQKERTNPTQVLVQIRMPQVQQLQQQQSTSLSLFWRLF